MKKYKLKNTYISKYGINVNQIVYEFKYSNNGLVKEEEKYSGILHIAITENDCGDYPFYVIPRYYIDYEL